jgi:hypothetical protein
MRTLPFFTLLLLLPAVLHTGCSSIQPADASLPGPGKILVDLEKKEVIVHALVQRPEGKPCIDDWGGRPQAFAGCRNTAAGEAIFADYFVFLTDAKTEEVYDGLISLGARTRRHITIKEGKKRAGLKHTTTESDYLQGDPVLLSVFWQEGERWKELPYDAFAEEKIVHEGTEIVKPWTPHFVFHGSGAIHGTGTGCIACPCDCPGGIIADNRNPVYNPKPQVRFDWSKAPPVGTEVYIRIRAASSRGLVN